jgi:SAGA-associated factor 29
VEKKILELEAEQNARICTSRQPSTASCMNESKISARGDEPSNRIDSELEGNLRENIKITNELASCIKTSDSSDICGQLELLSALRNADDAPPSASRATSVGHTKNGRDRHGKSRKLTDSVDDRESIGADSPSNPSPKVVMSNQKDRLMAKSGSSRAGSVPAAREASAKLEDDKDDLGKGKKKRSSLSSSLKHGTTR